MNCEQVKEQLELYFGTDELPAEIEQHLQGCTSCRAHRLELQRLSEQLGVDADFEPSASDLERAVTGVGSRIGSDKAPSIIPVSWLRPLSRVAAAILIVGVSYTTYLLGRKQAQYPTVATVDTVQTATSDSAEMDDEFVSMLINDLSSDGYFDAGELLMNDLTDEEMEYLKENMTVGDIL